MNEIMLPVAVIDNGELICLGDRVELHPGTDAWMQGDRFGTVSSVGQSWVRLRMERSGLTRRVLPSRIGRKMPDVKESGDVSPRPVNQQELINDLRADIEQDNLDRQFADKVQWLLDTIAPVDVSPVPRGTTEGGTVFPWNTIAAAAAANETGPGGTAAPATTPTCGSGVAPIHSPSRNDGTTSPAATPTSSSTEARSSESLAGSAESSQHRRTTPTTPTRGESSGSALSTIASTTGNSTQCETSQLELISLPDVHVIAANESGGRLSATVCNQAGGVPAWNFMVGRDGEGEYVEVSHWMPGPSEWSQSIRCTAVFKRRAAPHDITSMVKFARWMIVGEEG